MMKKTRSLTKLLELVKCFSFALKIVSSESFYQNSSKQHRTPFQSNNGCIYIAWAHLLQVYRSGMMTFTGKFFGWDKFATVVFWHNIVALPNVSLVNISIIWVITECAVHNELWTQMNRIFSNTFQSRCRLF